MSDVIAGVRVNGEMLVYIDYDKPVCQNAHFEALNSTPSIEHFMVDGVLGSASLGLLSRYGVTRNFSEEEFWGNDAVVDEARKAIYAATDLELEYIHFDEKDPLIVGDLSKFASGVQYKKVDEKTFYELIKPTT
jgi:hypothetical protein